ncbi:uncharacterized protein LOC129579702 [Sitodiplosis mosellana]|uniref:uncharacterized protein LOC129579702 n=1 Tax=Sitodiplosis mosellana TaxID=263140 RepID=UPI0024439384|nr:uncharacterized protein LOC129579702 [Sitodiplosis mosellana]
MKELFLICAVISAAVLVNGSSNEPKHVSLLAVHLSGDDNLRITDEQIECIQDGEKKIIDLHPNLKEWFDDVAVTSIYLTEFADSCHALSGIKKRLCFVQLSIVTIKERKRLFGNLNDEQKTVLEELKKLVEECLKEESNSLFSLFDRDDTRITDKQKQCIEDGYQKVASENPAFASWIDDIQKTFTKLAEDAQRCGTLTNWLKKVGCYVKYYVYFQMQYQRLFGKVTEKQQKGLKAFQKVVTDCLLGNAVEAMDFNALEFFDGNSFRITEEQDGLALLTNDGSIDVFTSQLLDEDDTRITDEQKQCYQDGLQKVASENPALKPWFDDITQTFAKLAEDAKRCGTLTDWLEKLRCNVQSYNDFQREYGRLFRYVTQEQQKCLEALQKVVADCLQGSAVQVMDFNAFNFFDGISTRITEEQIQCLLEGYKDIVDEELQEWFNDVVESVKQLAENLKECEKLSGLKQLRCYTKLVGTAHDEYNRLNGKLSKEQKEVLKELGNVIQTCLSNDSVY